MWKNCRMSLILTCRIYRKHTFIGLDVLEELDLGALHFHFVMRMKSHILKIIQKLIAKSIPVIEDYTYPLTTTGPACHIYLSGQGRVNLEKIRGLRKQKNLTQWQIAQKIGYKTAIGYHYLERVRCKITAEQLDVIASALGVTTEELYE